MKVELKTYWPDLIKANEFVAKITELYPNLKVYINVENDTKNYAPKAQNSYQNQEEIY